MIGVILGTGPSLADVADDLRDAQADGKVMLFGMNDSHNDFNLDVWIACDPKWHEMRGPIHLANCDQYHWCPDICKAGGYRHIKSSWWEGHAPAVRRSYQPAHKDPLRTDPGWISLGHSSGWQCLNLAVHYHMADIISGPILLCGYDMTYREGEPRHYFKGVSDVDGEYDGELRKWSLFDKPDKTGLLYDYKAIADQLTRGELPCKIINCTPRSAMKWFPIRELKEFI